MRWLKLALSNAQYDQVMREYSRIQAQDHHETALRRQTAYKDIPQLAALTASIAEAAVAGGTARLSGNTALAQQYDSKRHEADSEIRALLAAHGYPPDYLEMHYQCGDCKDTGYVNGQKCRCFKRIAIRLFYTQPSLQKALLSENFSTFSYQWYDDRDKDPGTGLTPRENMQGIVRECRNFVSHFEDGNRFLLFYGGPGLGKTFLSHCIAGELMKKGFSVLYYSASGLFDTLARSAFGKEGATDPFIDYILACDLLIVDDLGTEITNAFVSAAFFRILNERLAAGKSMLISTNLTLPDLASTYSERSFSRISSSFTLLGFYGEDIRIRQKLAKIMGTRK